VLACCGDGMDCAGTSVAMIMSEQFAVLICTIALADV